MTNYRVKAYVSFDVNYYKVQEQVWWGWKTVAKNIKVADNAAQVVRNLLEIEKEFIALHYGLFMTINKEKNDE